MAVVITAGRLQSLDRVAGFATGINSGVRLYDGRTADYATIWRTQPNVRTVVDFLARNLAQLGVHLYRRRADDDRERITDHPFVRRLRQPNPADRRSNTYRLVYSLVQSVCVYDSAFAVLFDGGHPDGPAVIVPPTSTMRVAGDNWLWPDHYEMHRRGGWVALRPEEVVHLQGSVNLDDPRFGVSPIEALRGILSEEAASTEYREQFWRTGARISGLLTRPAAAPRWKDGARERFRTEWQEAYAGSGPSAGGTPILEDGMSFVEAGVSARDSQWLEARKLTREEVAAAFHVHPAFVGILEHANFANMREQHKSLYTDTLGPWLTMLDADLTLQMLPAFADPAELADLYVELNFREKLRGSLEEEADAIIKLTGAPVMTRNEGRALLNRNSVDGGDELITPLNVLVGGQTIAGEAPPGDTPRATGTNSRPARVKAAGLSDDLTARQEAAAVAALERFITRQGAAVASAHGAAPWADVAEIFDRARWDAELTADLAGLATVTATVFAAALAASWDFDAFDDSTLTPLITANAAQGARHINDTTEQAVAAALADPDGEGVAAVFTVAVAARVPQIARTRTTWAGNFGRAEVASQSGRTEKIWRVTSQNPRPTHATMNGETVPIGALFGNGMKWPGDPAGGAAETANCTCTLDFTD